MFLKNKKGQAALELALSIPLLMLVVFGLFDFTRAMMGMMDVTMAAREGARQASISPTSMSQAEGKRVAENSILSNAFFKIKKDDYKITVSSSDNFKTGTPITILVTEKIPIIFASTFTGRKEITVRRSITMIKATNSK